MKNILSHYLALASNPAFRYAHRAYLLEGSELIYEFVSKTKSAHIKSLCMSREFYRNKLPNLTDERRRTLEKLFSSCFSDDQPVYLRTHQINRITNSNSEGIMAEVGMIDRKTLRKNVVVLDGVNNPGNMGALLRSAVYFNWDTIVISPGSTDPFGVACVRAARNAQSHLNIELAQLEDLKKILISDAIVFLATPGPIRHASEKNSDKLLLETKQTKILILGSESHGISEDVWNICKGTRNAYEVHVLNSNPVQMESLNVSMAGAILMSKLQTAADGVVQLFKLN